MDEHGPKVILRTPAKKIKNKTINNEDDDFNDTDHDHGKVDSWLLVLGFGYLIERHMVATVSAGFSPQRKKKGNLSLLFLDETFEPCLGLHLNL